MFDKLIFNAHRTVPGAMIATHTFENGWTVSVATGPWHNRIIMSDGPDEFDCVRINPAGKLCVNSNVGHQDKEGVNAFIRETINKE